MIRFGLLFFLALSSATAVPADAAVNLADVGFDQRLGAKLPLATALLEPDGTIHRLHDYFHRRPVVLYFGYAGCPQLCSLVADGTVSALRQISPTAGRDFDVVSISIDPAETAAAAVARLADSVHRYGDSRSSHGWHYLRGSAESIRSVADAAGFRFAYDAASRQYAHASGFVVVTPDGVVSRYFPGVDFDAAAVARALNRAARGEIGEPVFDRVLRCFRGDGVSGRYNPLIWAALAGGTSLTVVGLAGWIAWSLRRERQLARREAMP